MIQLNKIYSLDSLNVKSLNEFGGNIIVVRIALLFDEREHLPFVDNSFGHLILCIQ